MQEALPLGLMGGLWGARNPPTDQRNNNAQQDSRLLRGGARACAAEHHGGISHAGPHAAAMHTYMHPAPQAANCCRLQLRALLPCTTMLNAAQAHTRLICNRTATHCVAIKSIGCRAGTI